MNLAVVAIVATVLLAVANPSLGAGGTQLHSGLGSPSVHCYCIDDAFNGSYRYSFVEQYS